MKHVCSKCDGEGRISPSGLRCWNCDDGLADGYHQKQKIILNEKQFRVEQIIKKLF